ncbi:hypothetical protein, variant 1 [Capsaspora owczarzaki ATCC 30864]|nr:hypothetical protein, variant 1 [Capsaspora owczarzaki ATCC 30864]
MRTVLTAPSGGYYMRTDVFGAGGDFTTSPEISPLFGEMIGAWLLNHWQVSNSPKKVNLIEFGPGRGTLMHDVLRIFARFKAVDAVHVHFVEKSPALLRVQAEMLGVPLGADLVQTEPVHGKSERFGIQVTWHQSVDTVPDDDFSLILAHEFFDALPALSFTRTERGWREVLVDLDEKGPYPFRLVTANAHTVASRSLLVDPNEAGSSSNLGRVSPPAHVRSLTLSPDSFILTENLSKRIINRGGAALIIDYGYATPAPKEMTLRAFRGHKEVHLFDKIGMSDLTVDVDFEYLAAAAQAHGAYCTAATPQGEFLEALGIGQRLARLLGDPRQAEHHQTLKSGVERLTSPTDMGQRFKAMAIVPQNQYPDNLVPGLRPRASPPSTASA